MFRILYLRLNISVQTIDILLEAIILVVSCVALRIGIPKIECKYTFTTVLMMPKKQSTNERSTTIYCVQPYNTQISLFGGLHKGVVVVVLLASWPQFWIQLLLQLPTWMKALLGISFQISLLKQLLLEQANKSFVSHFFSYQVFYNKSVSVGLSFTPQVLPESEMLKLQYLAPSISSSSTKRGKTYYSILARRNCS